MTRPAEPGTAGFVRRYLRQTAEVALASDGEALARAIEVLYRAYENDGTIFTCGNGGSAANASHLACDIAKLTWAESKKRFQVRSLCDNAALISALTNDMGFHSTFVEQLRGTMRAGDVLVCLSVHGGAGSDQPRPWSENLLAAASYARRVGAEVIALLGYDGGELKALSDVAVIVPATKAGETSTPLVEGLQEVYHQLICLRLLELVRAS